ncbi:MAG TPA: NAD-dependent epimerase/dehydratase family protein [Polyangiales bacterium]|jgi:CDP-paratose 2-epimerase
MNPILITGGAGFIGTNAAHRLMSAGRSVIVLDNLSRPGVEHNIRFLTHTHGARALVEVADVRDVAALQRLVPRASAILHFAAQTAVTTSLTDPEHDFDVNAGGTLKLLEVLRTCEVPPPLVFTSTNKVYGSLADVELRRAGSRYEPIGAEVRARGISEQRPLDFHTPYGCSKGTADQYVLEYARGYGMPAIVFRMSCIYGPHQCGTEDQGWVANFVLRALEGVPINLYGDGMQVRDLLFASDLIDAFELALEHIDEISGEAFNIGGGPQNAASLLEVIEHIRALHGGCSVSYADWRPSDQRYYVSNTEKFQRATGWAPRVSVEEGIRELYGWALAERKVRRAAAKSALPREAARNSA